MNNIKYKRIFITGASGTGKTTLARWISINSGLPFISTSAKEVWPNFGITDHKSAITKSYQNPEFCMKYQWAVFGLRYGATRKKTAFVTDRSPFDIYAHFMLQGGELTDYDRARIFASTVGKGFKFGDLIIFLRFNGDTVLEDDNKRIMNRDTQCIVDGAINTVIEHELIIPKSKVAILEIGDWDLDKRKIIVKRILTGKRKWLDLLH